MRDSTKELIADYEARIALMKLEGTNQIESRRGHEVIWNDDVAPMWNFEKFEYRVKPKPVEGWAWKYPSATLGAVAHLYNEKQPDDIGEADRVMVLMREVTE